MNANNCAVTEDAVEGEKRKGSNRLRFKDDVNTVG